MGLGILWRRQRFLNAFATCITRSARGCRTHCSGGGGCGWRDAYYRSNRAVTPTAFFASVWPTMLRSNFSTTCFGVKSDRSSKACMCDRSSDSGH